MKKPTEHDAGATIDFEGSATSSAEQNAEREGISVEAGRRY